MKINENSRLLVKNVYVYDIESCHYNIMKSLGLNLDGIDPTNKLERNIAIGKRMQKNPSLTKLLRQTTEKIINEYIRVNDVRDSEILLRQYDGIILNRTLRITDLKGIPLNIRKHFIIFISSIDRRKYIAMNNCHEVTIKGMSHRYDEMDSIYKRICSIVDYANKESIFRNLQKLKDYIMTTDNIDLFAIPSKSNKFNVYLKEYGQLEVSKQVLKIMDTSDIDRKKYFDFYIAPFTKSIVVEYVK